MYSVFYIVQDVSSLFVFQRVYFCYMLQKEKIEVHQSRFVSSLVDVLSDAVGVRKSSVYIGFVLLLYKESRSQSNSLATYWVLANCFNGRRGKMMSQSRKV